MVWKKKKKREKRSKTTFCRHRKSLSKHSKYFSWDGKYLCKCPHFVQVWGETYLKLSTFFRDGKSLFKHSKYISWDRKCLCKCPYFVQVWKMLMQNATLFSGLKKAYLNSIPFAGLWNGWSKTPYFFTFSLWVQLQLKCTSTLNKAVST